MCALKGGACGRRAGQNPALEAQNDLAVRANVHGNGNAFLLPEFRGHGHANGIRTYVSGDVGQHVHRSFGMHGQADFFGLELHARAVAGDKRGDRQIGRIHAQKQVAHGGVAHDRGDVGVFCPEVALPHEPLHGLGNAINDELLNFSAALGRGGRRDPGEHVGAENSLGIGQTFSLQYRARIQIDQINGYGCRPDVNNEAVALVSGVARLYGDQLVFHEHCRHRESGLAQHARQFRQQGVGAFSVLAHLGQDAFQVGKLIAQRWLRQCHKLLLHRAVFGPALFAQLKQADFPFDIILPRGDLDHGVTRHPDPAGKHFAVG